MNGGCGVYYAHKYDPPREDDFARRAMGTLDVFETLPCKPPVARRQPSELRVFVELSCGNVVAVSEIAAIERVGYSTRIVLKSGHVVRVGNDDRKVMQETLDAIVSAVKLGVTGE